MSLKDALTQERTRKREAEEAAARPHEVAYAQLKALFHQIMDDRDLRDWIHGEVELNGDELQIDPGPILIRASVDGAGDFHLTYEIKSAFDPVIQTLEVKSIPDIEQALATLLVQYEDFE
ncbi:MAG TPA: hypothetical protein VHX64_08300 [Caulobacteraceae bacterium]|nr:hypothetical protein [Caulobacteraceae bacterium]